jgi:hypothetical protein
VPASFTVNMAQTISFVTPPNTALTAGTVTATATSDSGLPVSMASTTPAVCTTTSTSPATVTLVSTGTCTLQADQAGNGTYTAATQATATFMVLTGQTITFVPPPDTPGMVETVVATATTTSPLPVTLTSTTQTVCVVQAPHTSPATIDLIGPGQCTLHANQAGDNTYAPAAEADGSFEVTMPPYGSVAPMTATASGAVVTVTWDPTYLIDVFSTMPVIDAMVTGGTVGGNTCVSGLPISSTGCVFTATQSGTYTITATPSSIEGSGIPTTTTIDLGMPGTPTAVTGMEMDGQLMVSWTPSTQLVPGVRSYTAIAGTSSCSTVDATEHTCVIAGLMPGTSGTVSVIAHGTNGVDSAAGVSGAIVLLGAPAGATVRNANGHVQIFWRGTNNAMWTSIQAPNGSWGTATSVGGGLFAEPVVARDPAGRLQAVAVGNDGRTTYQNREITAGSNIWAGWTSVTNNGLRNMVIEADHTGRLHLVATTGTGAVMYASMTDSGVWNAPASLAGGLVTSPLTVIRGPSGMLVVYGRSLGVMYQIVQNGNGTWPSTWTRVGVASTSLSQSIAV